MVVLSTLHPSPLTPHPSWEGRSGRAVETWAEVKMDLMTIQRPAGCDWAGPQAGERRTLWRSPLPWPVMSLAEARACSPLRATQSGHLSSPCLSPHAQTARDAIRRKAARSGCCYGPSSITPAFVEVMEQHYKQTKYQVV